MDLATAITKVTDHFDWEEGETPDPFVAVFDTRETLDVPELESLDLEDSLERAYRTVLRAEVREISRVLRESFV